MLTRPGTATAFPLRLRLHYKAARAGGVRQSQELAGLSFSFARYFGYHNIRSSNRATGSPISLSRDQGHARSARSGSGLYFMLNSQVKVSK